MSSDPKRNAAEKAVEFIRNDMIIGLGTGSTAYWAIQKIGELIKSGLRIHAVASSLNSENLARQAGITIVPFEEIHSIDITIDGADEVDRDQNLIKGGGGALLREKILAFNSKTLIIVIDESKLSGKLGHFPLPVEIVPFAASFTMAHLKKLTPDVRLRIKEGQIFNTDNGNYIADCSFQSIADPERLNDEIHQIPGTVETGLFSKNLVSRLIIGWNDGKVTC